MLHYLTLYTPGFYHPMMQAKQRFIPLAVLILSASLNGFAAGNATKRDLYRELQVEGEDRSLVTATTTLFLDDNHPGFRLTGSDNTSRPYTVIDRRGSRVSIYFSAHPGETLYLEPATELPPPPRPLPIHSGLLHRTREYGGEEINSVSQFNQLWKNAAPQGGAFAEQVYSSYNPFGPNSNTLHRYEGMLRIDNPGITTFCVASTDASFLLINGEETASWPGKHPVTEGLNGSKRGTLALKRGIYRLTYLHANSGEQSFAIASVIPPGTKQPLVIDPQSFTRAAYAFVSPLTSPGKGIVADFTWENSYMLNIHRHSMYKVSFEAAPVKDAEYRWKFGDGTTAQGRIVEHLLFREGAFRAELTVTLKNRTSTSRQTLNIRPRYGQNEHNDTLAISMLDQAVIQEKERGIQPEGYALISRGYFFFLLEEKAAEFAPRILSAVESIPRNDRNDALIELAMNIQEVNENYDLAEKCFKTILTHIKNPRENAFAALHYAGMLTLCMNRPEEAKELLEAIDQKHLIGGGTRLWNLYLADTALVLNDFATAQKMYKKISRPIPMIENNTLNRMVIFDYNSRSFRLRNLVEQKRYREALAELKMIEWDMPEERAAPRTNLIKAEALAGNNQPRKAIVCLQRALMADVDRTYTAKLRLELAKIYAGINHFAQAEHQIARICRDYPSSLEEIEARELSKHITKMKLN